MKKLRIDSLLSRAWLALAYIVDMLYIGLFGKRILDSDLAAEMVLSDLLNKEGSFLSKNWYYSNELRVFESPLFYRLGLFIFPDNWHAARVFATAIILFLLALSFIFLSKALNLGNIGIWGAGFLLFPFGFWHMFYTTYGNYYAIYIIFTNFALYAILNLTKKLSIRHIVLFSLCAICSGLNGVRQFIVFFAPLFVVALINFIMRIYQNNVKSWAEFREKEYSADRFFLVFALIGIILNGISAMVNMVLLGRNYSFNRFGTLKWENYHHSLGDTLLDFLSLFGFQDDAPVFSFGGVASIIGVIMALLICFVFIRTMRMLSSLKIGEKIVVLLFPVSLSISLLIFCFLFEVYYIGHWLPLVVNAILIICIWIKNEDFKLPGIRCSILACVSVSILTLSAATLSSEVQDPFRADPEHEIIADFLVENNYTCGVGLFWDSVCLRELSNGLIDMYTIEHYQSNWGRTWLQEKDHVTLPRNNFFIIFNNDEEIDYENSIFYLPDKSAEIIYTSPQYQIVYIK